MGSQIKMTPDEAVRRLQAIQKCSAGDPEIAHVDADRILCDLLIEMECGDVVNEWLKIDKWYA